MSYDEPFVSVPSTVWAGYEFDIHDGPDDELIPFFHPGGGVYIFAKQEEDSTWFQIYIGQSKNVARRVRSHERWPEAVAWGASHVLILDVYDDVERYHLEGLFLHRYSALLNERRLAQW